MSRLQAFYQAVDRVYGSLSSITDPEQWNPPPSSGGHRGRYLWTDAFGVLNFLTLHRECANTPSPCQNLGPSEFLTLAERLVQSVHSTLGYTRSGSSRLPGATDDEPLKGGLRIGKEEADGADSDGQYFHYLTLWMIALNRLSIATEKKLYNDQAISLAQAIHPHFFINRTSSRPRMVWKLSTDMSDVLVPSEGNLDPLDGYVVYRILQASADKLQSQSAQNMGETILDEEIKDYKRVIERKGHHQVTRDPLDLGMTMWTVHWLAEEDWAADLLSDCRTRTGK